MRLIDRTAQKFIPGYSINHAWGAVISVGDRSFIPLLRYRTLSLGSGSKPAGGGYSVVEPLGFLTMQDGCPKWIGFVPFKDIEGDLDGETLAVPGYAPDKESAACLSDST